MPLCAGANTLDWRHASLLLATLFLSPHYWLQFDLAIPMYWSILPFAGITAVLAIVLAAILFWAPALAAASTQPQAALQTILARSLGTIAASALRFCAICFLVLWMATLLKVNLWWMPLILRREASTPEVGLFNAALMAFVLVTAFAMPKLAKFSNKLGVAILLAALIRVRDGLPAGVWGFTNLNDDWLFRLRDGLSPLIGTLAPIGLLAATTLGRRLIPGRKQLALTAGMGFALPLFLAAVLTGITIVGTARSHYYRPSLQPTLVMALWSNAAASAMPGRLLIVIITMFGALRFGMYLLADAVSTVTKRWLPLVGLALAIAGCALSRNEALENALQVCAACLLCAAAIVSVEGIFPHQGHHPSDESRLARWPGLIALLAGCTLSLTWNTLTGSSPWFQTWTLPAYATSVGACLLQRLLSRPRIQPQS